MQFMFAGDIAKHLGIHFSVHTVAYTHVVTEN